MSELQRYVKALVAGNTNVCIDIEQKHGLYGYPPEIVSVGLKAVDAGNDPEEAVEAYMAGKP